MSFRRSYSNTASRACRTSWKRLSSRSSGAGVITARQRDKIERKYFELRYVRADADGTLREANANEEGAIHVCYLGFDAIFDAYQQHQRQLGEDVKLSLGDVRRELEREPYWIPLPKTKASRCHRIRMGGARTPCWVINLERQPGDEPEHERHYICPFAEQLIDVLTPIKPPPEE